MKCGAGRSVSSHFLPADRAGAATLAEQIDCVTHNEVVDALLRSWCGAVAVLNAERQIVAVNAAYLDTLGIDDPAAVLGLRPGEALRCEHADEGPGGCGTSAACASCGQAVAIVASVARERPEERDCVLTLEREGERLDLDLRVRACPLVLDDQPFTLVTMVDVSTERRRAALERAFFHDLANLVAGLNGAAEGIDDPDADEASAARADLRLLTARLSREVQLQRALASSRPGAYRVAVERVTLARLVEQVRSLFQHHPAAVGKGLAVTLPPAQATVETDGFLLQRIVGNMVVNAFEATPPGGEVRLAVEEAPDGVTFRVWNAGLIPLAVQPRVFHRYFTTKPGEGRGQGTYVVKLLGERFLGGRVSFTSAAEAGTAFELRLPRSIGTPAPPWAQGAEGA